MKALTIEEVRSWVASQPRLVIDGSELRFQSPSVPALHFHYPTGEGQLPYFARLLPTLHHEEAAFAGAMLWFTAWGIWSDWVEDIGRKTVALLRGKKTKLAPIWESPGQLFDQDDLLASVAFLLQPILVGWDAYLCPLFNDGPTDFIIKISHDAYADVIPENLEVRKQIQDRLSSTDFREANCRRQ